MNRQQLEEQLKKLSGDYQNITNDKDQLWLSISEKISEIEQEPLTIREVALETPMRTPFMKYAPVMLVALVVFGSGVTAVSASQNTIPGDLLYPLQRAIENVREKTIVKSQNKIEFKIRKAEKRLHEINEIKSLSITNKVGVPTEVVKEDYQEAVFEAVEKYEEVIIDIEKKKDIKEKKKEWEKRLKVLNLATEKLEDEDDVQEIEKNETDVTYPRDRNNVSGDRKKAND